MTVACVQPHPRLKLFWGESGCTQASITAAVFPLSHGNNRKRFPVEPPLHQATAIGEDVLRDNEL